MSQPELEPIAPANRPATADHRLLTAISLGLILAVYAFARGLEVATNPIPRKAIVALDVLSAMAFALVHGARQYRLRGILVFAVICIVVGNVSENLGVVTGFPFGRYYFVELMGPKLLHVPVLLGLAYIGMAYVSWVLGCAIAGRTTMSASNAGVVVVPIVASFIMVAWDVAQDPVWSTVLHGWVWLDGGPWFGVPVSNYMGWYATVFVIFQIFALVLRWKPTIGRPLNPSQSRTAVVFYGLCAAGNVLQVLRRPDAAFVQDPAGNWWRVANIIAASALVSIFVMGGFAALAWIRLAEKKPLTD